MPQKQQLEPEGIHTALRCKIAELTILCDAPGLPLSCALVITSIDDCARKWQELNDAYWLCKAAEITGADGFMHIDYQ